jgi:hypothetical protein
MPINPPSLIAAPSIPHAASLTLLAVASGICLGAFGHDASAKAFYHMVIVHVSCMLLSLRNACPQTLAAFDL